MSEFSASLLDRVQRARQAVRSAERDGDDERASLHSADLQNLERLAAEHGVEVPAARGELGSAGR